MNATTHHLRRFARPSDRGAVLVVGLVGLAIAGILFINMLKSTTMQARRAELMERQLQADCLVESGLRRAVARLAADPEIQKESWNVAAEQLPAGEGAEVVLEIQALVDRPGASRIRVTATYGDDPKQRIRRAREIIIKTPLPRAEL